MDKDIKPCVTLTDEVKNKMRYFFDYVKPLKKGYITVDIKTTQDASVYEFQRKAYYKYYYHLQAAHYIRGFEAVR